MKNSLDRDLTFLRYATDDDLFILYRIITGECQSYGCIRRMLPELIREFRRSCGNSFANFFDYDGPSYSEILRNVAYKCNVIFNDHTSTDEDVELLLLYQLLTQSLDNCSDRELKLMLQHLKFPPDRFDRRKAVHSLISAWQDGSSTGFQLMGSVVSAVLSKLTGQCIIWGIGGSLIRLIPTILGPMGWLFSALSCVAWSTRPNYKNALPVIIHIALIRQKIKFNF